MEKTLICITTCNRLDEVKKYILPYINCVNHTEGFHFVLAHDGFSQGYINFCKEFEIPLIYSDEREGVGLSKNRVLKQFPDFDHYFFIDDDVELVKPEIFKLHINFATQNNFHHLVSTRFFKTLKTENIDGIKINYGLIGGGYFSYFSKKGIEIVGGWHTEFAQYKRYGHTEHSYRFVNRGLSSYPFVVITKCINMLIVHSPEHVTEPMLSQVDKLNELFEVEKQLIESKISYYPIKTISKYTFNYFPTDFITPIDQFLSIHTQLYPFLKGKKKKRALSSLYFNNFITGSGIKRFPFLIKSFLLSPTNPTIKHWVKTYFLKR